MCMSTTKRGPEVLTSPQRMFRTCFGGILLGFTNLAAPNVRTACLWQKMTIQTNEVQLPLLKTYHYDFKVSLAVQPSTWSQGNVSFIDPYIVRTVWIDDAQNIDAVTAGLIILSLLNNTNDTYRSALGCSIDARWDESHHVQADGPLDIAFSQT